MKGHVVAVLLLCIAPAMSQQSSREEVEYFPIPEGLVGCDENSPIPDSRAVFHCSEECTRNSECMGFHHQSDTNGCILCNRMRVSDFAEIGESSLSSTFYVIRHQVINYLPLGETRTLEIKESYLPGAVIHFKAMILEREGRRGFNVDIGATNNNRALHMWFRRHHSSESYLGEVTFSSFINGNWSKGRSYRYPVKISHVFNVYILITRNQFVIQLDEEAIFRIALTLPLEDLRYVKTHKDGLFSLLSI